MNIKRINQKLAILFNTKIVAWILSCLNRKESFPSKTISSILMIKLEGIGDSVYLIELVKRLKTQHVVNVEILTSKKNPIFDLLNEFDSVIKLHIYNPLQYFYLYRHLKKKKYDLIIDCTGLPINIPLFLIPIQSFKIGLDTGALRSQLYSCVKPLDKKKHIFDIYKSLISDFYEIDSKYKYSINVPPLLNPNISTRYIALVLSSNSGGLFHKRIPAEHSIELLSEMCKKWDCPIVLIGGGKDKNYLIDIIAQLKKTQVIYISTNLLVDAMAVLKHSYFNLCIDSGLMHLASLVNEKTFCLFGYSDPTVYLPFRYQGFIFSNALDCSPCSFYTITNCSHLQCMQNISTEYILKMIEGGINKNSTSL